MKNHLRHALNAQFSHKVNRFEFKYRFQYQSSKEMGQTASINNDPTKKLRLKVGGAYNIKNGKLTRFFLARFLEPLERMGPLVK